MIVGVHQCSMIHNVRLFVNENTEQQVSFVREQGWPVVVKFLHGMNYFSTPSDRAEKLVGQEIFIVRIILFQYLLHILAS